MKSIKLILLLFITVVYSCTERIKNTDVVVRNNKVSFIATDTIVVEAHDGTPFSSMLFPISVDDSLFVAYDEVTQNLLFSSLQNKKAKPKVLELQNNMQMYKSIASSFCGIKGLDKNRYLLCSNPYFLEVDSLLFVKQEHKYSLNTDTVNFRLMGGTSKIQLIGESVLIPIEPDLPISSTRYFDFGRIAQFDLKNEISSVLPVKLPFDYKRGENYILFALPLFTNNANIIYYIYPGSSWLYSYNVNDRTKDSVQLTPKHTTINVKGINNIREAFTAFFECSNWYQLLYDGNTMLLFYWKGKEKQDIKRGEGLKGMDCFVLGYSPKTNEILFDQEFNIEGCVNNPLLFNDGILYLLRDIEEDPSVFKSEIVKYEVVIKNN